jgi:hypothetical protein
MSYAPIYAKLRDLEERLINIESLPSSILSPPIISNVSTISSISDPAIDYSSDLTNLQKDCSLNSSSITQIFTTIALLATKDELVSLATKDELVSLATKDELVSLATKDELVPLATKDELVSLATKDELVSLATKNELVSLATKDELVPLATKDELVSLATKNELVPLATKDELVPLATKDELVSKDELANLFAKFDNIIDVVAQLNTRIDELYTKIQ